MFLNNDTEVRTPDWLEELVMPRRSGTASARSGRSSSTRTAPSSTPASCSGMRGTADHVMRGFPGDDDGYAGSLSCTREVSAVTGACMLVRRGVFAELGGFDEHFATHYQDVDLCLRIRALGPPHPLHAAAPCSSITRAPRAAGVYDHVDRALLLDAWGETIARGDPYYNPLLSLSGTTTDPRVAA